MYPDQLTVASTGGAARQYPSLMGEYTKYKTHNNRPTYRSVDGDGILFYSDLGFWSIKKRTRRLSGLRGDIETSESGLLHIPEKGWEYFGRVKIQEDDSLTVSYGLFIFPKEG